MQTYNCVFDEDKFHQTQEAVKNYFTLKQVVFVEDTVQGETGWSWIVVAAESRKKNGQLKNYLTTVTLSKLSDTQLQVSIGRNIKASKIFTTIGAGTTLLLLSPLAPLISLGIIGGIFTTVSLTSKSKHVEKEISDLVKINLGIKQ